MEAGSIGAPDFTFHGKCAPERFEFEVEKEVAKAPVNEQIFRLLACATSCTKSELFQHGGKTTIAK